MHKALKKNHRIISNDIRSYICIIKHLKDSYRLFLYSAIVVFAVVFSFSYCTHTNVENKYHASESVHVQGKWVQTKAKGRNNKNEVMPFSSRIIMSILIMRTTECEQLLFRWYIYIFSFVFLRIIIQCLPILSIVRNPFFIEFWFSLRKNQPHSKSHKAKDQKCTASAIAIKANWLQ